MENLKNVLTIDYSQLIISIILILVCLKFVWELLEWVFNKLGIEFRVQREKKEYTNQLNDISNKIGDISLRFDKIDEKNVATEFALKEVIADRINQKYKEYLGKNGIPEDEVDEFVSLHSAYKGIGGNHTSDIKFDYCMTHLPILPCLNEEVIKKINE